MPFDIEIPTDIDQKINDAFAPLSNAVADVIFYTVPIMGYDVKIILVWLVIASVFFTLLFGFINLRGFKHAIDIVRGKFTHRGDDGQITPFQALMASLSGTVGLGNIGGVAVAVSVGGAGAAFWMAVMGLLGMSAKFAEVAAAVKYRHHPDVNDPTNISGGPMYYIRDAFRNIGIPYIGPIMGGIFCLCCIGGAFGGGNMFQANQSFQQILNVTGGAEGFMADKGWMYGVFLAILTGLVIIGGIRSIANAAEKIVPFMGGIYLGAGIVVIAQFYQNIPSAFEEIFRLALRPEAGFGGLLGALLMGVQRAAFSNEAGIGSAAIVHAAAKTDSHIRQGFVGMLGPFIDTVIICMITALVIVITGAHHDASGMEGISLTSRAFEQGISFFPYILALTVFLFAYSTLITWSYYGLKAVEFLFGEGRAVGIIYKLIFLGFIIVGASSSLDHIILFSDAMIFAMAIPNLIGLYLLAPTLRRDLTVYLSALKSRS